MPQNQALVKSKLLHKTVPAMVILIVTLGMLIWQFTIFQGRQEKLRAAQNSEETAGYQWRAASNSERDMAIKTVKAHLAALNKSDYAAALRLHSQNFRGSFRSQQEFLKAMQNTRPQFDKSKKANFGKAQTDKSARMMMVPVQVLGRDGLESDAIYEMIYEKDQWLVAGINGGKSAHKPTSKDIRP